MSKPKMVKVAVNAYEKCQYFREIEISQEEYDEWRERFEEDRDAPEEFFDLYIRGACDPIDGEVDPDDVTIDLVKPKKAAK